MTSPCGFSVARNSAVVAAIELRVRGLDAEEEAVLARTGELRHVEQRMMRMRQAVEEHHSQESRECRHQDQQLERDGNEDRPTIVAGGRRR